MASIKLECLVGNPKQICEDRSKGEFRPIVVHIPLVPLGCLRSSSGQLPVKLVVRWSRMQALFRFPLVFDFFSAFLKACNREVSCYIHECVPFYMESLFTFFIFASDPWNWLVSRAEHREAYTSSRFRVVFFNFDLRPQLLSGLPSEEKE